MDLTRTSRLVITRLLLGILPLFAGAQQRQSYDPAGPERSSQPQQGFIGFTLSRINASNQDYGKCIDESRKILLDETLKNGYFWSNVVSLGLLGCLFLIIIHQRGVHNRHEWKAAEMLAQYQHALSAADAKVDEAAKKNLELIEALRTLRETAIRSTAAPADVLERTLLTQPRNRVSPAQPLPAAPAADPSPKPASARSASTASATESVNQMGLFKPDVELIMKVNSLEQQLGHSREEAKQLRRQLGETDRRFQSEQGKNRSLKGA
ncbi:MAG: hypothetical protein ACRD2U_04360 [Terriglobales bacterium]